jgi:hypothetical protein
MTLKVRHVSEADVGAVHDILQARHVERGTMRLRYSDVDFARQRIKPVDGTVKLVATFDEPWQAIASWSPTPTCRAAGMPAKSIWSPPIPIIGGGAWAKFS